MKINLRESLNELDMLSDNRYDLYNSKSQYLTAAYKQKWGDDHEGYLEKYKEKLDNCMAYSGISDVKYLCGLCSV